MLCMQGFSFPADGKDRKSPNMAGQKHPHDCVIISKVKKNVCWIFWESCAVTCQCFAVMFMWFPKSTTQYSDWPTCLLPFVWAQTLYICVLTLQWEIYFIWKSHLISGTFLKQELPVGNSSITLNHYQQNSCLPMVVQPCNYRGLEKLYVR